MYCLIRKGTLKKTIGEYVDEKGNKVSGPLYKCEKCNYTTRIRESPNPTPTSSGMNLQQESDKKTFFTCKLAPITYWDCYTPEIPKPVTPEIINELATSAKPRLELHEYFHRIFCQ